MNSITLEPEAVFGHIAKRSFAMLATASERHHPHVAGVLYALYGGIATPSEAAGVLGPDVVLSNRGTYHLPACDLARGISSARLKRAVAKRLGYIPCGVCRPG
jgi:hypothetical protein